MELHRSPTPRNGDRRVGERRSPERAGPGRRRGERRKSTARAGLLVALLSLLPGGRILLSPSVETSTDDFRVAPDVTETKKDETDPSRFDAIIEEASALYGVNSALVKAVIQAESQFNPLAVSRVGAKGLMQLMPMIAKEYGALDPLDAKQNVFAGVKYLSDLLDRYNGNVSMALAGYNAGPTAVKRFRGVPPYRETRGYVRKIQNLIAEGVKSASAATSSVAD
ncbi:MAG TPA: lytic transglycosylase domain-containing protein [Vicinamibacteria bacterium]|jgi:soluble lytic murein transglycosylase-like protein